MTNMITVKIGGFEVDLHTHEDGSLRVVVGQPPLETVVDDHGEPKLVCLDVESDLTFTTGF